MIRRQVHAHAPVAGRARPSKRGRALLALVLTAAALLATLGESPPVRAQASDPGGHAARATELITAMEYDQARAELAKADPNDLRVVLAKARLALYEEDCDLAVALLARQDVSALDDGKVVTDVARGCARVTAATVVEKDEANGVVIRFHDDADRALAPLLIDTVVKARESLTRDLGVEWKRPTRITVVRDLLSLSAMTGLPYKSAQTTGTVAVAKWGRVTILSPRASHHGYAFRDTLTHEMTHLAISMQSRERAPLWLHEGVARREEVRWRPPGPFDDRPAAESIVLRGMAMKLDLPLDQLGPSIAMLPSADAATVAFAEVSSFVRFFVESSPPDALARLLVALRSAPSVDAALKEVSGETLAQWDVKWRANLQKIHVEPLSPLYGLGQPPPGLGDSRERSRLAELLFGRSHPAEALGELDEIPESMFADPSLRYARARAFEADGKTSEAAALLEDPKAQVASYGPCWAVRGRLARAREDTPVADASFFEALAHDPLSVESACEVSPLAPPGATAPPGPTPAASGAGEGTPLCDAARARNEPDLGRD
jgi:hypothetical protein